MKSHLNTSYLKTSMMGNGIDKARFEKPDAVKVDQFMDYLSKNRVNARLRRSRGKDIDAACGQLANKG